MLRQFLNRLFARWEPRRKSGAPMVVRWREAPGATAGPTRSAWSYSPSPGTTGSAPFGAEEAARQIFHPLGHGESESYGFTRVGSDGTVPHRGELWDREGNSMRVQRRNYMLVTCSGNVVRSPEEITCICTECRGVDSVSHRCVKCGVILCQLHANMIHDATGTRVYCRTHLAEAIDNRDTWADYDRRHGTPPAQPAMEIRSVTPIHRAPGAWRSAP